MSGRVAGTISWVRNCTFWKRGTGPIIAACVEQGGQDHETLDARCIAHILEHGRALKTHPDRVPTALVDAAVMNLGSGGSMQENTGSMGAMREREYFEAPQSTLKAFPCRIEPMLFDKVRMAQSCR